MKQRTIKELDLEVAALQNLFSAGSGVSLERIEGLVSEFETVLSRWARPPGRRGLAAAGRLAGLLELLERKIIHNLPKKRKVMRWRSRLYQAMAEREKAWDAARVYMEICPGGSSAVERAECLMFYAKACYWSDRQREAVSFQRVALDILERAAEEGVLDGNEIKKLNRARTVWAFRYAQNTCRWSEAAETFERARELALEMDDPALLSDSLILYAEARMFQGEWEACERLARECVEAAREIPGGPVSDYPFWIWGRALAHTGEPRKAVLEIERGIELARKTGDAVGLSEALASLAEARLALGEHDQALQNAARAEEVARYAKLGLNLAQVNMWRSRVVMEIDSERAADQITPLHAGLGDFERIGCLQGIACACAALGHAHVLVGNDELARSYLARAVEFFSGHEMPWHSRRAERSLELVGTGKTRGSGDKPALEPDMSVFLPKNPAG